MDFLDLSFRSTIARTPAVPEGNYPLEIQLSFFTHKETADLDNLWLFRKKIIDLLVRTNKIPDDDPQYIRKVTEELHFISDDEVPFILLYGFPWTG